MTQQGHDWIRSTLGHGETMCRNCFITNREAAALGLTNKCDAPAVADTRRDAPENVGLVSGVSSAPFSSTRKDERA